MRRCQHSAFCLCLWSLRPCIYRLPAQRASCTGLVDITMFMHKSLMSHASVHCILMQSLRISTFKCTARIQIHASKQPLQCQMSSVACIHALGRQTRKLVHVHTSRGHGCPVSSAAYKHKSISGAEPWAPTGQHGLDLLAGDAQEGAPAYQGRGLGRPVGSPGPAPCAERMREGAPVVYRG